MNYLTFIPLWEKILPGVLFRAPNFQRVVFLTFDDGPHPTTTPQILEILAEFGAQATFFVRGDRIPEAPGVLLRILKQGHALGNHGFSHRRLWVKKRKEIIREVEETNKLLQKTANFSPQLFRPPYGKVRPGLAKLVENLGLKTILWSVDARDYAETTTSQDVVRTVLSGARSGSIVLLHDAGPTAAKTREALPIILKNLTERGFQLLPLSVLSNPPATGSALA